MENTFVLKGNLIKLITRLSIPIVLINLTSLIYGLADAYWIGKINYEAFAAVTFVTPVINILLTTGNTINAAGIAIISQNVGKKNSEASNKFTILLFVFSIISSVILVIVGCLFVNEAITFLGAKANLKVYSGNYMNVVLFDLPMAFMLLSITASMIGHGDTKRAMIINTGAVLLNLILDPVFIFTLNLNIKGAALATVLSKIPFVFMGFILLKRRKYLNLNFENLFDRLLIRAFLRIAIPVFLGLMAETIGYMFLHSMTAGYGSSPLAALGIVNIIIEFVRLPSRGIATVLATIVGQNLGARNFERVRKSFKISIGMTVVIMVFLGGVMVLCSRFILEFFITDNAKAVEEGIMYLNLQGLTIIFLGMNACLMKFFEGVGRSEFSMSMNIVRLWAVRIPLIWICGYFRIWGVNSVWYAMVLGNMVAWLVGVVGWIRIRNFK